MLWISVLRLLHSHHPQHIILQSGSQTYLVFLCFFSFTIKKNLQKLSNMAIQAELTATCSPPLKRLGPGHKQGNQIFLNSLDSLEQTGASIIDIAWSLTTVGWFCFESIGYRKASVICIYISCAHGLLRVSSTSVFFRRTTVAF